MTVADYTPQFPLREFIAVYKVVESDDYFLNNLVPSMAPALSFRLSGQVDILENGVHRSLPVASFTGLRSSARQVRYNPATQNLVVVFKPLAAPAFFKIPLHTVFDQMVPLGDLVEKYDALALQEKLFEAKTLADKIGLIEAFLLAKLNDYETDKTVLEAVRRIKSAQGAVNIKILSQALHLSQDAFEKRFRKLVGSSPKKFAGIVRMHAVIRSNESSLYDLAYKHDFYDPAHFTKEFTRFTGQSPKRYFNSPKTW